MCGRYYIGEEESNIEFRRIISEAQDRLFRDYPDTLYEIKTGEIFPTNIAPILTPTGAVAMRWGFPKWDGKGHIINARSDTAIDKKTFRESLLFRRCVVPTSGFYEWHQPEGQKKKDKYLFALPDSPLTYIAGFYNIFKDDGRDFPSFVILTTAANESMPIHDRMPVMLRQNQIENWLADNCVIGAVLAQEEPMLSMSLVK